MKVKTSNKFDTLEKENKNSERSSVNENNQNFVNINLTPINPIDKNGKYLEEEYDHMMKIILVGESSVGKTNICMRYCYNKFHEDSRATVSFEVIERNFKINNDKIKVCIWDTLGQEKFASVFSQYYRATDGAFFVFDLTDKKSFEKIDNWVQTYNNHGENKKIIKYLIGNKSDLVLRKVKREDINEKIDKYEFDAYYETSALKDLNIKEMIENMIKGLFIFFIFSKLHENN